MLNTANAPVPGDTPPQISRRGLLQFLGAGAGAVAAGAAGLNFAAASPAAASPLTAAGSSSLPLANDANFWRQVEKLFTLNKKVLFMNVGTVGSPPREVLDALDKTNRDVARDALSAYSDFADVRAVAARGYGCDVDELVISHNTSDGMSKIIAGLNLREGDEILTTNHEHGGGLVPMGMARDRHGVVIRKVALPVGNDQRAEDYVELFRKAITAKTKVLLFSAPTYKTGTMLPIPMLAKLAQEYGLTSVVDGAHIPGMMNYSFHELGVDFLAGSAAKWQCGPGGTGVLYIRNKVLSQYNPNPLPEFWPVVSSSYPAEGGVPPRSTTDKESYNIGSYLQSVGNGSLALNTGVRTVCEVWDRIGRQRIEDHVVGLSSYLKELVAERWGVQSLYSPKDDSRLVCALTSFNPFRNRTDVLNADKSAEFVARMSDEYGITIRNSDFPVIGSAQSHRPVRISTHLFHQSQDVNRLVDAAWKLSGKMA
ncbi:aminotransferase class V-fold PLP-dependent enzyme [Micromonospora sp. NPDC005206]|uniref:aminotransferase class V-fold PLP-dependent enzyme n=1 Tax=Micromonospora sp. NPDC005206 TaxID=3157022 RepID=UPI0033B69694